MSAEHEVAKLKDLPPGELLRVDVGGKPICLARLLSGSVHAIGDTCTHEQESLSDGYLDGEDVECPLHASRFNVHTGDVEGLPADIPVATFTVRMDGESIFVEV